MAVRTVNVRLLVSSSQFNQGMMQAGSSVRVLASSLGTTAQQAQAANERLAEVSKVGLVAGGALTGAFAYGAKVFMDFDKQMSAAGAAAQATGSELESLRQAAIQAGADTAFSATEAAGGIEELAKAGVSAADITGGALKGSLDLAAAGGLDVAEAAETAASAMTIFGLSGKDVGHIADVLAASAGKAQGSVHDMGMAFNQSALVAEQTGLSLEDTAGALAMFASNGLIGSDAGTSFKTMLMSLNPRSKEAAELINQLGISAYDQQGNFIGLAQYADRLQQGMAGLSVEQRNAALQTIFGTDAIRAASILYNEGATGVLKWTDAVDDSGYAAEQGAARMDNLSGDLEKLRGSVESAILGAGSGANNVLRDMAQRANDVVQGFMGLPGPLQEGLAGFTGIAGASITVAAGLGLAFSKLNQFAASMSTGGALAQGFASKIGLLKGALGIAALAVVAFTMYLQQQGEKLQRQRELVDSFTQAVKDDSGALGEHSRALIADNLAKSGAIAAGQKLGLTTQQMTDAAMGSKAAMDAVKAATDGNAEALQRIAGPIAGQRVGFEGARDAYKDAADAATAMGDSATGMKGSLISAAAAQQETQVTIDGVTYSMNDQTTAASLLKDALDALSGKAINARQAQLDFDSSLLDVTASLRENSGALGDGSKAAIENEQSLLGLIEKANAHAQAVADESGSVDLGTQALNANKAEMIASLQKAGLLTDGVQALIDKYFAVPTTVTTSVNANLSAADKALNDWLAKANQTVATVKVVQTTIEAGPRAGDSQYVVEGKATGGRIDGPGSSTSDSIPIMASKGEYVIKASAAQAFGYDRLDAINGGRQVMTPIAAMVNFRSPSSQPSSATADAGSAEFVDELVNLRRAVDQQTAVLAGATERQTRTLSRTQGMDRRSGS